MCFYSTDCMTNDEAFDRSWLQLPSLVVVQKFEPTETTDLANKIYECFPYATLCRFLQFGRVLSDNPHQKDHLFFVKTSFLISWVFYSVVWLVGARGKKKALVWRSLIDLDISTKLVKFLIILLGSSNQFNCYFFSKKKKKNGQIH